MRCRLHNADTLEPPKTIKIGGESVTMSRMEEPCMVCMRFNTDGDKTRLVEFSTIGGSHLIVMCEDCLKLGHSVLNRPS